MLHVLVLFGRVPVGAGRETRRRQIVLAVALIVVGVHAARIVGVVAALLDMPDQVAAGIDGLHRTHLAVDRPGGHFKFIIVVGGIEQRDFERLQGRTIRGVGLLVEDAGGGACLDSSAPAARSQSSLIRYSSCARTPSVGHGVDGAAGHTRVVELTDSRRHTKPLFGWPSGHTPFDCRIVRILNADIGVLAR